MKRWILTVCLLSVATASLLASEQKLNVDFELGWGNCYRPMQWTPVELGVMSKIKDPINTWVTVSVMQDQINKLVVRHPLVLTPQLRRVVPLVTKFGFSADTCTLSITDEKGRTLWKYEQELWDYRGSSNPITLVQEYDVLIGLVGGSTNRLGKLSDCWVHDPRWGEPGKIYVKHKLPPSLPIDWTGYAPLDLLILYDPDWDRINRHQGMAIAQWVSNGGSVLLVFAAHPPPTDGPLTHLLPLTATTSSEVDIPPSAARKWGKAFRKVSENRTVTAWSLSDPAAPQWKSESYGSAKILFAHGPVGFGSVAVLSFDPAVLYHQNKEKLTDFWITHLRQIMDDRELRIQSDQSRSNSRYRTSSHQYTLGKNAQGSNAVLQHLLSIPELRPLSVWWVVSVLVLLTFLLGPVNYLVLKRLDRLPLTWITSAICIAIVTAGAYYAVQWLRAGKMQLRAVTVQDAIAQADCAWSTCYSGIFAPASRNYHLTQLEQKQWFSGIAPTASDHLYRHGRELGSRRIVCAQYDGANHPVSLPINIWSMQTLIREGPLQNVPIEVDLERDKRHLTVTITNNSELPIRNGCVRLANDRALTFKGIPPKSKKTFSGAVRGVNRWDAELERYRHSYQNTYGDFNHDNSYYAQGSLQRTRAIEKYLKNGAAVVCVSYEQAPPPYQVEGERCNTNHIKLVRVVVFPKEKLSADK